MKNESDLLVDFESPCATFTLTFDDNGKVAYAYMKKGRTILGDVWLYNRCPTPVQPEWKDRKNLPFANCEGYIREEGRFEKAITLSDISVKWDYSDGDPKALVYISGELIARVGIGDKPGYSRFASKSGPLAKLLDTAGPV